MNAIIDNKALAQKSLPTELKILNWGKNETVNGTVYLNDKTLAVFAKNQAEIGRDKDVPIDFDHCTVPGTDDFIAGQPKSIAGYGNPELIANDGLYLKNITWTPLGEAHARNYKDLSPALRIDDAGVAQQLHSCALTPTGAVNNLMFYSADQANKMKLSEVQLKTEDAKTTSATAQQPNNMDNKIKTMAAYDAPESVADKDSKSDSERVLFAFLAEFIGEHPEFMEQLTKKSTTEEGGLNTWATKVEGLSQEIETFKAEVANKEIVRERQAIIDQATKEGKVIALSATAINKLDVTELKEYVGKLEKVVPMKSTLKVLSAGNETGKPSRAAAIAKFNEMLNKK